MKETTTPSDKYTVFDGTEMAVKSDDLKQQCPAGEEVLFPRLSFPVHCTNKNNTGYTR
ncbi:hypothetical protein ZHAS_00014588 [Anopheles sinensis]|uniref:Uncharacterized protein n=1 Tax=Anopheles sinensis TaxID=74873 RepID=A0A084W8K9_ANOSI|nr:hypothetical protein ZHAS_00014588 [Anopheles sinensis]